MAGVVRLDKVKSVYSGNIFDVVSSTDELENGMYAVLGEIDDTKGRDVFKTVKPVALTDAKQRFVLISSPEIMYDECLRKNGALGEFKIPTNTVARAYALEVGDIVSISTDLIDQVNNYQKNNLVIPKVNEHRWEEKTNVTTETFVMKILGTEEIGSGVVTGTFNANKVERKTKFVVLQVVKA